MFISRYVNHIDPLCLRIRTLSPAKFPKSMNLSLRYQEEACSPPAISLTWVRCVRSDPSRTVEMCSEQSEVQDSTRHCLAQIWAPTANTEFVLLKLVPFPCVDPLAD